MLEDCLLEICEEEKYSEDYEGSADIGEVSGDWEEVADEIIKFWVFLLICINLPYPRNAVINKQSDVELHEKLLKG